MNNGTMKFKITVIHWATEKIGNSFDVWTNVWLI